MDFFRNLSAQKQSGGLTNGSFAQQDSHNSNNATTTIANLQSQILQMTQEEKKLRERCQKTELEKSLLQNFIDRIYNDENDESDSDKKLATFRSHMTELQNQVVTLEGARVELQDALQAARDDLAKANKKCDAFDQALQHMTVELKDADEQRKASHVEGQQIAELQSALRSKTRLLEEREITIQQLMERITRADQEHAQVLRDYEAILHKSSDAHNSVVDELSHKTDQLTTALQELAEARVYKGDGGRCKEVEAQLSKLEAERTVLLDDSELLSRDVFYRWPELRDASHECVLSHSMEVLDHLFASMAAVHDKVLCGYCEAATGKLSMLQDEIAQLRDRLDTKEARIVEARAFLQQAEERSAATEDELAAVRLAESALAERLCNLEAEQLALQSDLRASQQESEQLRTENDLMRSKLLEDQKQAQSKLKQANQLVKDLQGQLQNSVPINSVQGSTDKLAAGSNAEADALLRRIGDMQEKIWLLETAKKSYEGEIDRLTKENETKSAIVRTHFVDAAQKYAQQKGKLGGSLFGPSKDDVNSQAQKMLEETLAENMKLENQLRAMGSKIERLEILVADAVREGFAYDDDVDDVVEEEDHFS